MKHYAQFFSKAAYQTGAECHWLKTDHERSQYDRQRIMYNGVHIIEETGSDGVTYFDNRFSIVHKIAEARKHAVETLNGKLNKGILCFQIRYMDVDGCRHSDRVCTYGGSRRLSFHALEPLEL